MLPSIQSEMTYAAWEALKCDVSRDGGKKWILVSQRINSINLDKGVASLTYQLKESLYKCMFWRTPQAVISFPSLAS